MNILFVDFDGVLNSKQHILMTKRKEAPGRDTLKGADYEFMKLYTSPTNMWVLKYILDEVSDLKIVISSAWRNHFEMGQFRELFKFHGLDGERIIGKTPGTLSHDRKREIHLWLEDYKDVKWAALDDHAIFDLEDPDKQNEILTDSWVGLSMHDAFKIIRKFKPDYKEPGIIL